MVRWWRRRDGRPQRWSARPGAARWPRGLTEGIENPAHGTRLGDEGNDAQFDLIVTGNFFGDILSDAAAMPTGSIGMLPSASLAEDSKGPYEPVHGTAPDIAGKKIANPIAAFLPMGMRLRYAFAQGTNAYRVEAAVHKVLAAGYRAADFFQPGSNRFGTAEMGDAMVEAVTPP